MSDPFSSNRGPTDRLSLRDDCHHRVAQIVKLSTATHYSVAPGR